MKPDLAQEYTRANDDFVEKLEKQVITQFDEVFKQASERIKDSNKQIAVYHAKTANIKFAKSSMKEYNCTTRVLGQYHEQCRHIERGSMFFSIKNQLRILWRDMAAKESSSERPFSSRLSKEKSPQTVESYLTDFIAFFLEKKELDIEKALLFEDKEVDLNTDFTMNRIRTLSEEFSSKCKQKAKSLMHAVKEPKGPEDELLLPSLKAELNSYFSKCAAAPVVTEKAKKKSLTTIKRSLENLKINLKKAKEQSKGTQKENFKSELREIAGQTKASFSRIVGCAFEYVPLADRSFSTELKSSSLEYNKNQTYMFRTYLESDRNALIESLRTYRSRRYEESKELKDTVMDYLRENLKNSS